MKLEIKNENYNRFMKRKEIGIDIEHPEESTPSMAAVQQLVAKQTNAAVEKVEVKEIVSARGAPSSSSLIFVWDEKNVKDLSKKPQDDAQASGSSEKTEEAPKE